MTEICQTWKLLPDTQNGFLRNRDTASCIIPTLQLIKNSITNNTPLYLSFIDLAKAFDSVNHVSIHEIMTHMNLGGYTELINTFLLDNSTIIETEHGFTELIYLKREVR